MNNPDIRPEGCKCDFLTFMVGDGCEVCNPDRYLEILKESLAVLQKENKAYERALEKIATHNSNNPIAVYLQNIAIKALGGK